MSLSGPETKAGRLQRALLDLLAEHQERGELPTSNRFLFYELEHPGVVRKSKPGEGRRLKGFPAGEQDLIDATFQVRERGVVPWSWLVDDTRELHEWWSAPTVAEYLLDALDRARLDPWLPGVAPMLLCESRTFGGVMERTLAPEYRCPVAATNGQAGGFLRTDVAPALRVGDELRRVLYVGDLDLAGEAIEENTRRVLERETDAALDWTRLALTAEQAREHGLSTVHKTDNRYRDGSPHKAIEVEVLGQGVVTAIVRAGLDALLPELLERVLERERAEREELRSMLEEAARLA